MNKQISPNEIYTHNYIELAILLYLNKTPKKMFNEHYYLYTIVQPTNPLYSRSPHE